MFCKRYFATAHHLHLHEQSGHLKRKSCVQFEYKCSRYPYHTIDKALFETHCATHSPDVVVVSRERRREHVKARQRGDDTSECRQHDEPSSLQSLDDVLPTMSEHWKCDSQFETWTAEAAGRQQTCLASPLSHNSPQLLDDVSQPYAAIGSDVSSAIDVDDNDDTLPNIDVIPFACQYCSATFPSIAALDGHQCGASPSLVTVNVSFVPAACQRCKTTFPSVDELNSHKCRVAANRASEISKARYFSSAVLQVFVL